MTSTLSKLPCDWPGVGAGLADEPLAAVVLGVAGPAAPEDEQNKVSMYKTKTILTWYS